MSDGGVGGAGREPEPARPRRHGEVGTWGDVKRRAEEDAQVMGLLQVRSMTRAQLKAATGLLGSRLDNTLQRLRIAGDIEAGCLGRGSHWRVRRD